MSVLKRLPDELLAEPPQPLGLDGARRPGLDRVDQRVGNVRVLEVGAIVF